MSQFKTTWRGKRIGVNASKRKEARANKVKRVFAGPFRWLKRRGWILGIVLVVLGFGIWQGRFYLQHFNPMELRHLQYINIEGNRMLSIEDIIQAAGVELGMLMSEVNDDSVKKSLLQLPLIHSVDVKSSFPSSLHIMVQESLPVVSLLEGGKGVVYSERGLPLPMSMTTALRLPVIDKASIDSVGVIARFLNDMRNNDEKLYNKVSQVVWSKEDKAIEVYFRDVEYKVLFPHSGWNKESFTLYEILRNGLSKDVYCAGEIDMRYAGYAYVRKYDKRCVNG